VGAVDLAPVAAPVWTIATKADLGPAAPDADLALSVRTGEGIDLLIERLKGHIEQQLGGEPALVGHLRDREALDVAISHVRSALARVEQPELCAEDLRRAADRLAGLIGLMDSEAVLDRLFAGFCIGK